MALNIVLAVVAVSGFIGALPQMWGSNWKKIWFYHWKGIIPWDAVHKGILNITGKLRDENFSPTMIIGVGRGGIVCAGLLCSKLTGEDLIEKTKGKYKEVQSPKIKLETINSTIFLKQLIEGQITNGTKQIVPRIDRIELSDLDVDIQSNNKILIIVAQNFTGGTLEKATKIVINRRIKRVNVRTAALFWHKHEKLATVHEPDIFGMTMPLNKTTPWKYPDINTDRY